MQLLKFLIDIKEILYRECWKSLLPVGMGRAVKTIIRQMHTPVVALAVLLVLGILFNACGGSSQGSGQTTSTTPTSSALSKPTQAGPVPTTTEHVPTPTAAACGTQLSGVTD